MRNTNLQNVDMQFADLNGTELFGEKPTVLELGVTNRDEYPRGRILGGANLEGANLKNADFGGHI
jgi:uncharacterized protein YjbI with pentapeptide repeats